MTRNNGSAAITRNGNKQRHAITKASGTGRVLRSQVHGESVDTGTLIPHMLQAFIARDRGFKAIAKKRPASTALAAPT